MYFISCVSIKVNWWLEKKVNYGTLNWIFVLIGQLLYEKAEGDNSRVILQARLHSMPVDSGREVLREESSVTAVSSHLVQHLHRLTSTHSNPMLQAIFLSPWLHSCSLMVLLDAYCIICTITCFWWGCNSFCCILRSTEYKWLTQSLYIRLQHLQSWSIRSVFVNLVA